MKRIMTVVIVALLLSACGGNGLVQPAGQPQATPATPAAHMATPTHAASPTATSVTAQASPESSAGNWIKLTPSSGPPGTAVTLTGFLPKQEPPAGKRQRSTGVLCWDGCAQGALMFLSSVTWSEQHSGEFSATFTVPRIPWIVSGRIRNPAPGSYRVGVVCLGIIQMGCIDDPSSASATFRMTAGPARSCNPSACASVKLSRQSAASGDIVEVSGWAPLVGTSSLDIQLTGTGTSPRRYDVAPVTPEAGGTPSGTRKESAGEVFGVTRAPDGTFSGSFYVPLNPDNRGVLTPGSYTVELEYIPTRQGRRPPPGLPVVPSGQGHAFVLARARISIVATPSWTSVGAGKPLWTASSLRINYPPAAVDTDPANPSRLSRCTANGISVSDDSGNTWHTVPVKKVDDAAAAEGFQIADPLGHRAGYAVCLQSTLDPTHNDSLYAVFGTYPTQAKSMNTPDDLGFYTTDAGSSWKAVPLPPGYAPDTFGGFRVVGNAVEALFSIPGQSNPSEARFIVEQTTDGGRTWKTGHLACPDSGPYVVWGPAPAAVYPYGWQQTIYYSTDNGRTWLTPDSPIGVGYFSQAATLVALSPSTVVLLSPSSEYPVEVSRDGGRTWQVTTLPSIPGVKGAAGTYVALLMLPSGALLALPPAPKSWDLLAPGARTWWQVSPDRLPAVASGLPGLAAAGNRLWWLDDTSKPPEGKAPLRSTAISGLGCGGS